jgi:glycerol-3-phosphate dehydrogenase
MFPRYGEMKPRSATIEKAATTIYDVCVIGGGASGAGCALDSQLRGFKTVVVDAGDFGSGTSTASTKLIHGGLRYLEQAVRELDIGQYRVVRLALQERALMMRNAPHLSGVCEFVVPCFSVFEAAYYDLGLKLYDWISGDRSIASSHFIKRAESLKRTPCLKENGLFGAVVYSDGQFDDARYNLALVQSCVAAGGDAINYARVQAFEKNADGKIVAAVLEDRQSASRFKISAETFVNATGPYCDTIRRLAVSDAKERIRLSKGVHILLPLPEEFGTHSLLIPKTEDGRVIFAIPWRGRLLVGTTESEVALGSQLIVSKTEAEFLIRHLNRYVARPFEINDVVSAIAGLRPLVASGKSRDTKSVIRDYEIEVEARSGLISVLGGKWTIYRAMAEDAIDKVQKMLTGRITDSPSRNYPLFGAEDEEGEAEKLSAMYRVPKGTLLLLKQKFGRARSRILELTQEHPSLLSPIVSGCAHIQAEVVYCVREEMAVSLEDILSRRLGLQLYDWRLAVQSAPVVARILERELGWSPARTRTGIEQYIEGINRSLKALGREPVSAAAPGGVNDEVHRRA